MRRSTRRRPGLHRSRRLGASIQTTSRPRTVSTMCASYLRSTPLAATYTSGPISNPTAVVPASLSSRTTRVARPPSSSFATPVTTESTWGPASPASISATVAPLDGARMRTIGTSGGDSVGRTGERHFEHVRSLRDDDDPVFAAAARRSTAAYATPCSRCDGCSPPVRRRSSRSEPDRATRSTTVVD